jgi:Fis family transcriptional regulator
MPAKDNTGAAITAAPTQASAAEGAVPLRRHAEQALSDYFANLDGARPARLYDLVMREVEQPLFKVVLDYADGNQSRAATILGINRGTLRKKLRVYGIAG